MCAHEFTMSLLHPVTSGMAQVAWPLLSLGSERDGHPQEEVSTM
jgi:hypothetical protein